MGKFITKGESDLDYHKWVQTIMTASITAMVGILLNLSIQDHEKIAKIDTRVAILEDRSNRVSGQNSEHYLQFPVRQYAILPKLMAIPKQED